MFATLSIIDDYLIIIKESKYFVWISVFIILINFISTPHLSSLLMTRRLLQKILTSIGIICEKRGSIKTINIKCLLHVLFGLSFNRLLTVLVLRVGVVEVVLIIHPNVSSSSWHFVSLSQYAN